MSDNINIITILTVSFNSYFHLKRLFKNLLAKAKYKKNIRFLIVDNTNGKDRDIYLLNEKKLNLKIIKNKCYQAQRSVSHASGLDKGLKSVNTDFTLIVDPDIHVFMENWDAICLEKIQKNEKTVIGAPYPFWKLGKVHDYPSVVFMFFKTEFVSNFNVTFYPFPSQMKRVLNSIIRKIIRLGGIANKSRMDHILFLRNFCIGLEKLTGISSPDTGRRIIKKFREKKFTSIVFNAPFSSDLNSQNNYELSNLSKDYEVYLYNQDPFITHMYSSGVYHWRTENSANLKLWIKFIHEIENKNMKDN